MCVAPEKIKCAVLYVPAGLNIYETAKLSIAYSKVKAGMPSNVARKDMRKCKAPTLVM